MLPLAQAKRAPKRGTSRHAFQHHYCLIPDHTPTQPVTERACCHLNAAQSGTRVIFFLFFFRSQTLALRQGSEK